RFLRPRRQSEGVMKVERSNRADAAASKADPKLQFKQALKQATPGLKPAALRAGGDSKIIPLTKALSSDKLATVRTAINSGAERLATVRKEGQGEQQEKLDSRLLDIICKELQIELGDGRAANTDFPGRGEVSKKTAPQLKPVAQSSTVPGAPGATSKSQVFSNP